MSMAIYLATQLFAAVAIVFAAYNRNQYIEERLCIIAVSLLVANCGCTTLIMSHINSLLK